jgi:hypothetical protein
MKKLYVAFLKEDYPVGVYTTSKKARKNIPVSKDSYLVEFIINETRTARDKRLEAESRNY